MAIPKNLYFAMVASNGKKSRAIYTLANRNQNLLNFGKKFETQDVKIIVIHCAGTLKEAVALVDSWNKTYKEENRYLEDY